jgi:fructokinase
MPPSQFKIVGIGEVLWDLLPAGKQLGGAPANFVCHAHALGANAQLISRVGDDAAGREIIESFRARGLPTETISIDTTAPTGTVSVEVGAQGHPKYIIHENVAWDRIATDSAALAAVKDADAICFGTLAQRTNFVRGTIAGLLAEAKRDALHVFDINLRPPFINRDAITHSVATADILKLNEEELPVLAEMFQLTGDPAQQLAALTARFPIQLIVLTRGAEGSMLFAGGTLCEHRVSSIQVRDTIGAGDSFTAAVTLGFLRKWPLEKIAHHASAVAAYVCTQPGATPPLPEALRHPFVADLQDPSLLS